MPLQLGGYSESSSSAEKAEPFGKSPRITRSPDGLERGDQRSARAGEKFVERFGRYEAVGQIGRCRAVHGCNDERPSFAACLACATRASSVRELLAIDPDNGRAML